MGPAARLIQDERDFKQGSLYSKRDGSHCMIGRGDIPEMFDCLGAFMWAYRKMEPYDRHLVARIVFDACRARHNHARLGKLVWEEAFDLLKGCGV